MAKDVKVRRGIQSVVIGLRVLSAVAARREPSSLSSIAEAAGLSASQTHRYLSSLIVSGMVRQEERLGLYDLDAGAIRIGLAALTRLDVFQMADEGFQQLANDTGRTCILSIWGDMGPTVVRWYSGNPPVVTSLSIGSIIPMLSSATGMIFYSFADDGLTAGKAVEECRLMGWNILDFDQERSQIRERLYASVVKGKFIPGLRAAAAPVFDVQGRLVLTATLMAGSAFPTSGDTKARKKLLKCCQDITESLGGQWGFSQT